MFGDSKGTSFMDTNLYDGQEIADRGNVIVVTVAYRVGALGFLSTGGSDLPGRCPLQRSSCSPNLSSNNDLVGSGVGNYGLWDQHAAIAWVNRNIKSFGGDPSNVTIFGESAGGAGVSYQVRGYLLCTANFAGMKM